MYQCISNNLIIDHENGYLKKISLDSGAVGKPHLLSEEAPHLQNDLGHLQQSALPLLTLAVGKTALETWCPPTPQIHGWLPPVFHEQRVQKDRLGSWNTTSLVHKSKRLLQIRWKRCLFLGFCPRKPTCCSTIEADRSYCHFKKFIIISFALLRN